MKMTLYRLTDPDDKPFGDDPYMLYIDKYDAEHAATHINSYRSGKKDVFVTKVCLILKGGYCDHC